MTDTTTTHGPLWRFVQGIWLWRTVRRHKPAPAPQRDPSPDLIHPKVVTATPENGGWTIQSLHDAMRYSS